MTTPTPVFEPVGNPDWFQQAGDELQTGIDAIIRDAINNQPRSLQKRIGPSEIGKPCDRWLLYKLAGWDEPERAQVAWKPFIGTAVHAQMEEIFDRENTKTPGSPTWWTERKLTVGYLPDGTAITGSSDLFHIPTGTVIDWKIVGDKQLANYRANGPSQQYRVQAHTYGGGFMLDPDPLGEPKRVAIYFLPRDRDFEKGYFWHEPWDASIWSNAMNRLNRIWRDWQQKGMVAVDAYEICDDRFCHWCQELKRDAARSERTTIFDDDPPY